MTDPKQLPYCINFLTRNSGDVYYQASHQNFKTIGDALRFICDLKKSDKQTRDRYLYKRTGRRGFDFINQY